jgi:hypothetical protein
MNLRSESSVDGVTRAGRGAASRRLMDRARGPQPREQRANGSCEDIDGS